MTDASHRNGGEFPNVPDCLTREAPRLAPLSAESTPREVAVHYATLATHYHEERIAIVAWMEQMGARWRIIDDRTARLDRHAADAPRGVPFAAFVAVCAIAAFLIGIVIVLALHHG